MKRRKPQIEPHLRVYSNQSVLVLEDGSEFVFEEGKQSKQAESCYEYIIIKTGLNSSYSDTVLSKSVTQSLTLG